MKKKFICLLGSILVLFLLGSAYVEQYNWEKIETQGITIKGKISNFDEIRRNNKYGIRYGGYIQLIQLYDKPEDLDHLKDKIKGSFLENVIKIGEHGIVMRIFNQDGLRFLSDGPKISSDFIDGNFEFHTKELISGEKYVLEIITQQASELLESESGDEIVLTIPTLTNGGWQVNISGTLFK